MDDSFLSLGLDVGTTTTALVLSRLRAENRAPGSRIPHMEITRREILYRSPIRFTPLSGPDRVDEEALKDLLSRELALAGIRPEDLDTGAVIITGETSRKENARAVVRTLSQQAGKFVVATAGPDLESILAARGAGALERSREIPEGVLHMDIGGGTSNLALCREGNIAATACLNVGGRLLRFDKTHTVTHVADPLRPVTDLRPGMPISQSQAKELGRRLAEILEMAGGYREKNEDFSHFTTPGTRPADFSPGPTVSFSGGVADCIGQALPWDAYGDLGPSLGQAIRECRLCQGPFLLGEQTIRATVIGAQNPGYAQITHLADAIAAGFGENPCRVVCRHDMAQALGQALALRLPKNQELLCLDGLTFPPDSYLDIRAPLGPALPTVIKTLSF